MTASAASVRRRALPLALAAGALSLGACSLTSPTTTMLEYAPADGVSLDGDTVDVRDLLLISHGNGAPAVVSGSVINNGTEPVTVSVTAAGAAVSTELTVEPGKSARLADPEGEVATIEALESPAGQSVPVQLSTGSETLSGSAPVLLPQGPYADFADQAGGEVQPHDSDSATESADH